MVAAWFVTSALAVDAAPPTPHGCLENWRSTVRPVVPNGVSLLSKVRPVRVWYDPAHPNSNQIAGEVLANLELAWDLQVDQLGFHEPILPDLFDGPELDVYLLDYARWSAFVVADSYAVDTLPGDGYNGVAAYMVIDRELPIAGVPSYVSHEFNHVCQYGTDWTEFTLPIWEGCATASQKWTVGDLSYWDYDIASFQEAAWYPSLTADSYVTWYDAGVGYSYEYGAALWVMMLDEKYTDGGGAGGVALWEAAANEGFTRDPDVVDAFATVADGSLGDGLNQLALARLLVGDDWDERGLVDAGGWTEAEMVPRARRTAGELPLVDFAPSPAPMITGQTFLELDLTGAADLASSELIATVTSASGLSSAVLVTGWAASGPLDDVSAWGPAPEVHLPLTGDTERVVIAVTNLGPTGWDGDDDAYVGGDQRVQVSLGPAPPPVDSGTSSTPTEAPTAEEENVEPRSLVDGTCGCAASPAPGGALLALALAGLGSRRRQRVERPCTSTC